MSVQFHASRTNLARMFLYCISVVNKWHGSLESRLRNVCTILYKFPRQIWPKWKPAKPNLNISRSCCSLLFTMASLSHGLTKISPPGCGCDNLFIIRCRQSDSRKPELVGAACSQNTSCINFMNELVQHELFHTLLPQQLHSLNDTILDQLVFEGEQNLDTSCESFSRRNIQ